MSKDAFERLEPCGSKDPCTVLRGLDAGNRVWLPDSLEQDETQRPSINSQISCQAPRRWHFGYQRQGQGMYRDGIVKKPEG